MSIEIIEVEIKDFKVLKNLKSEVKGCNVFLRGSNGVGKSSFMDFIQICLGKTSLVPPNTNVEGQTLIAKNGEKYLFSVKMSGGKPKVTVTLPSGMKDTNKSVIAGIVGANVFNPEDFVNLSLTPAGRKKQVDDFKQFLDAETREILAKCEANVKCNYDERTELNRDIEKLEGAIKLNPLYNHSHELHTFTETKTEQVLEQLKLANEHNAKVTKRKEGVETRKAEIQKKVDKIVELRAEIEKIETEILTSNEEVKQVEAWLQDNVIKPVEALELTISEADKNNLKFNQAQTLQKEYDKLKLLREESGQMTVLIETERQTIQDAIRDMDSPVEGLSFDENNLLYKGIPVHPQSLSKSEIKRLGIRLKIAENPELPLFIHEAECMDETSLKEVQELANEYGLEYFAEEVKRGEKTLQIEIVKK